MKRFLVWMVVLALFIPVLGVAESTTDQPINEGLTTLTAGEIMNALVVAKYPTFSIVEFNEDTDPNGLLGRPNRYTSKASALDMRISNKASDEPFDIDVEVFETTEDCVARVEYIASVYKDVPLFEMYMYSYGNALFRADFKLKPAEAEEYSEAFYEIVKGSPVTAFKSLPNTDTVLSEDVSTKDKPALIGDRVIVMSDEYQFAVTVENVYRGKAAAMFTKTFDRYNNDRMTVPKGKEWALVYLKIEGLERSQYPITLSDFDFHIVTKSGVDCGFSPLMGNPNPVNSMYSAGTQYSWFGVPVPSEEQVYMTYANLSSETYWFNLSEYRYVDTSILDYPDISKNDTGETVDAIQLTLVEYGYLEKVPSGKFDSNTISALKKFQKAVGIKADGTANQETLRRLFSGVPIEQ